MAQGEIAAHWFKVRVYYEDTDLAGIVYYANYLRFIERARSEMLRDAGIDQPRLKEELGLVFAVRRVIADYQAPAKYDDMLAIRTRMLKLGGARLQLEQLLFRDDVSDDRRRALFASEVEIACIDASGRPARLPPDVRAALSASAAAFAPQPAV
ncbi:MAG: tol-pal system-associated acyl-CoA thioesterase [Neomegalonema sp.]|nr:tol-pal system-associated acyl-CoA thioesterase [Neomegalonema sp.]